MKTVLDNGVLEGLSSGVGYHIVRVGDLGPEWEEVKGRGASAATRRVLTGISVGGERIAASDRFIQSMCRRFRIAPSMFNYFNPVEVFERVQKEHPRARIRVAVQEDPSGEKAYDGRSALAASDPGRPFIHPDALGSALRGHADRLVDLTYDGDGVVRTTHRMDRPAWGLGGDMFEQRFTVDTPIDGLGLPSIYLSLLRLICTNGMVGMAPVFRSEIQLGSDPAARPDMPLSRAIGMFDNDEGFSCLRDRLDVARNSPASLREADRLADALWSSVTRSAARKQGFGRNTVMDSLHRLTGGSERVGLASANGLSKKRQAQVPMGCTVFDLINFATEVTTHHRGAIAGAADRRIQAWVGDMISHDYDQENQGDGPVDGRDYYLPASLN